MIGAAAGPARGGRFGTRSSRAVGCASPLGRRAHRLALAARAGRGCCRDCTHGCGLTLSAADAASGSWCALGRAPLWLPGTGGGAGTTAAAARRRRCGSSADMRLIMRCGFPYVLLYLFLTSCVRAAGAYIASCMGRHRVLHVHSSGAASVVITSCMCIHHELHVCHHELHAHSHHELHVYAWRAACAYIAGCMCMHHELHVHLSGAAYVVITSGICIHHELHACHHVLHK